ncbi:hypothetical protein [Loigolactobacillus bifermentans]|uniref:hypothetical protein n=1 Tax=Loigolactobacillus bifermentans TaxID=1607 RepID=UPI000AC67B27|nr:hypothetical protein [Loigolactobacillus bifermentans]QGG60102.1 hypothetical protein LB003_06355 [Loigolactobacillus bifermentans]
MIRWYLHRWNPAVREQVYLYDDGICQAEYSNTAKLRTAFTDEQLRHMDTSVYEKEEAQNGTASDVSPS